MRLPAIPLITVDPYFSVWSRDETLNFTETVHWTGAPMPIQCSVIIDGEERLFLGADGNVKKITQTGFSLDALSTRATFANEKIELSVKFMTPLIPDDIKLLSRPVSFMEATYRSVDGMPHIVRVKVLVREDICLNEARQSPVVFESVDIPGIPTVKMGNSEQKVLWRSGDNIRIDWGYFYLSVADKNAEVRPCHARRDHAYAESLLSEGEGRLFTFAYDDVKSINYFGEPLCSAWNADGTTICGAITDAVKNYTYLSDYADKFSADLYERAEKAGGKKYAEILSAAYRQVVAAHKVAIDKNGDVLFISKECFSNGCAATVDVSYPSTPLFLIYNTELVKGMLRPIYKYALSENWTCDFAPHDAGQYPLVTGQRYGVSADGKISVDKQMPVEECGNMIITEANVALRDGNADFAALHLETLEKWCEYLIKFGEDPEEQLCTDDFAGHLAHNCNLSLKAIMGVRGMGVIYDMLGKKDKAEEMTKTAKRMAKSWAERAKNRDGSFRLAFDRPDTFSMKYNMVWDKIWDTKLFSGLQVLREVKNYFKRMNKYGLPLDSRAEYTKSDWLAWTATLADTKHEFEKFISPMWQAYNDSPSRVPLTDWYDTISSYKVGFQNRTVQGGLFIKMLEAEKTLSLDK